MEKQKNVKTEVGSSSKDTKSSSSGAIKKRNTPKNKKSTQEKSKGPGKGNSLLHKFKETECASNSSTSTASPKYIRTYSEELRARKKSETQDISYDENNWPSLPPLNHKTEQSKKIQKQTELSNPSSTSRPKKPFMDQPIPRSYGPKSLPSTPVTRKSVDKQLNRKAKTPQKKFEPYIPLFEVQQGLKRGEFIEGALRINPRNYEDAYISAPDGQMDIYIGGTRDRNRALNGDSVVVQVNPKQEWRVLCDAIKDYEEKHGQSIIETVYSPISSPCKIHTPDKFSRVQSRASSAWNGTAISERRPDSLEILGVDKLSQQFEAVSVQTNKKNRSKRQRMKKNKSLSSNEESKMDSSSQKSSTTSYSHGSSDDVLHKISSEDSPDDKPLTSVFPSNDLIETENLVNGKISDKKENGFLVQPSDKAPISQLKGLENSGNLNCDSSHNSTNNYDNWDTKESSLSIITTPDELLNFEDGNVIQQYCDQYLSSDMTNVSDDNDPSSVGGIVVAPHDLTGDEFTDSVSSVSSNVGQMEQIIEDTEFLINNQDVSNNNLNDNTFLNNVDNGNIMDSIIIASQTTVIKDTTEITSCKIEETFSHPAISSVAVVSDSSYSAEIIIENDKNRIEPQEFSTVDINVFTPVSVQNISKPSPVNIPLFSNQNTDNKLTTSKRKKKKNRTKTNITQDSESEVQRNDLCHDVNLYSIDDIMKHPMWPKFIQKTGKVVHILKRVHSCVTAGHLKLLNDRNPHFALFSPRDYRLPRLMVPMSECPRNFYDRPHDFSNFLFLARIVDWKENDTFAQGTLIKNLGKSGDIVVETESILEEYDIDDSEFSPRVINCLPKSQDFVIPPTEIEKREDFRKNCIFTIDPATARDMDDAVSCERKENGNYVVGVHIADVTYFIEEGNALDEVAESRATSVYLVQKVVPMLPRILCDNLCSLAPGQDRLTFSVLWEITPEAQIINQWFERSIINSCVKMSYEHAQDMIENPDKHFDAFELPEIYGKFTMKDIVLRVRKLHELALLFRKNRFFEGALRLDQTKLQFTLDHETGLPIGFTTYEQRDSHRLIEEFMLLANMTVAQKIYETYPQLAVLRRHPPPQQKAMEDVVLMCQSVGIHLDATSSGTLQESISRYLGDDDISEARSLILAHLCSKPMNCALYFCAGTIEDTSMFHHYALNVPLYTHFTSPIRRYPDILVHRLLGAALGFNSPPNLKPKVLQKCTEHCNEKKYNAKKISEMSDELFLGTFIQRCGVIEAQAMVIGVMDHSFDCLVLRFGIIKRVYCDKLPLIKKSFQKMNGLSTLTLVWKNPSFPNGLQQRIIMFSSVNVILTTGPGDNLQISASLKCPSSSIDNC